MLNIVMFSTSTCAHCKPVKKLLEETSDIEVSYVVVDKDQNGRAMAAEWGIQSVPTLLFIKNATLIAQQIGSLSREQLDGIIGDLQFDVLQEQPTREPETGCPVLCDSSQQENPGT